MKKILKRFRRLAAIITLIRWPWLFRCYSRKASILLWIPKLSLRYFGTDAFVWDMATLASLVRKGERFRVVTGLQIGRFHNKKIFFTLSGTYNVYGFADHTSVLQHVAMQLEQQGNQVYPASREVLFWENKAHMHRAFKQLGVNEPESSICEDPATLLHMHPRFPFLIKSEHSCASKGLYKIGSRQELEQLIRDPEFQKYNKRIIVQELINMRRDLRVILVGKEIVAHYWRINLAPEWRPTATSKGSKVDFDSFPEHWRSHIQETFATLGLTTGAFDITWQNDDLDTPPLYLEVSPFYQPNPRMAAGNTPYSNYKTGLQLRRSWDVGYVRLIFAIKHKQVAAYLDPSGVSQPALAN
ncbi:hypothetical protein C7T94_11710 [Pedobacter yulinensis]|uniref:ATP-grasp domain-containing protein n=1 Tax=Pedobacter yulinensis TaxID=2126353 RepID=A0A2T3HLI4_9SPHI|nr:hypothetical protein [Pedobacter yulinensis]PST83251.1 hypothetical protein C7T94_11710 [Pedobacter yulinensis]